MAKVLVTGGTGFLGGWTIIAALEAGYKVRTTVRSLAKKPQLIKIIQDNGELKDASDLEVIEADLTKDDNWEKAMEGIDYVLHVASPFPPSAPEHPDDIIKPAKEGTTRVVKAAILSDTVKHVVVTSSFAAVGYGHPDPPTKPYDESVWSIIGGPDSIPYIDSKVLAERAAWDLVASDLNQKAKQPITMNVLNPSWILGPGLKGQLNDSTSLQFVSDLLNGVYKDGITANYRSNVDVRDVAKINVQSLKITDKVNGHRCILHTGENLTSLEVANILKKQLPEEKTKLFPTKLIGSDVNRPSTVEYAKKTFNWEPISIPEMILASANYVMNST